MTDILQKLEELINDRAENSAPKDSYVAKMLKKGENKISQKVVEEAGEVIIAALAEDEGQVIYESADLLFHLMLLLKAKNVPLDKVLAELQSRMDIK